MDMMILGGLPNNISACASQIILKYFLILLYVDCIAGLLIYQSIKNMPLYRLIRCDYQSWCRRLYIRTAEITMALVGLLTAICFLRSRDIVVLKCGIVFLAQSVFLNLVQTFLMLFYNRAETGFCFIISLQIISVFFSSYLPGEWKLLLPGNWGCYNRSTNVDADGFCLAGALIAECILITIIWNVSWCIIRFKKQIQGK